MEVTHRPVLSTHGLTAPAGAGPEHRQLRRLVELSAAQAAASALQAAIARAETLGDGALLPSVLSASRLVWGGADDFDLKPGDATAYDRLRESVNSPAFLSLMPLWVRELRNIAATHPESGACTLATAFQLWSWTMNYFRTGRDTDVSGSAQAIDELVERICPLLAARCLVFESTGQRSTGARQDAQLQTDLCHVFAAHASATAGTLCAELVFGGRRHLTWDAEGCAACFRADELDELEGVMPGIASGVRGFDDVIESDGSHAAKAGPCARFDGVDALVRLRTRLDGCLTGAWSAKLRAAATLAHPLTEPSAPASTKSGGR